MQDLISVSRWTFEVDALKSYSLSHELFDIIISYPACSVEAIPKLSGWHTSKSKMTRPVESRGMVGPESIYMFTQKSEQLDPRTTRISPDGHRYNQ